MRIFTIAVALLLLPGLAGAQEDVFSLEGVVVTVSPTPRSRDAVAGHVSVLDGEELRARGLTSVAEALRDVGGVDVVRGGSFGAVTSLFVRGGESDQTLVLVDGVQVNRGGGGVDLSSFTLDNVERIEVVRGPASALYGSDAMAGVIQIVTRTGRGSPRVTASVETSSFAEPRDEFVDGARWSADVSGGSDRFGYSAALERRSTQGILAFNNRFTRTVFTGRTGFAPDERTRLDLALGVTDREYHRPTDASGRTVDQNAFDFGDETRAHLRLSRFVTGRLQLEGLLGVNEVDAGTDDAPDGGGDQDSFMSLDHFRRASAETRANLTLEDAVVTLGGELEQERQRSFSESVSSFGTSYGRSDAGRLNKAAFVHLVSEPGPFSLSAGVRLEDNERFGRWVTWQAGASVRLPGLPGTRFRARAGSAIKEPTFFENFASGFVVGNPALDPERSRSWEAGVEQEIPDLGSIQVTYFDQSLRDLIQYTAAPPSPGDPNYFNVAGAASRGVEVDGSVRWAAFDAGASYTWLDTEVTDSGFDDGPGAELVEGERLLRRPTHTFALHAARTVADRGRVYSSLSYVGDRADRSFDPETFVATREELPAHALWTVGGEWRVIDASGGRPSVSLSARVDNLLDETYEEVWGFRAPGRQVYLGASVQLGGGE